MSSDESDNEEYALFGTPLEPIRDEDVPRKKPVPIEEQVVTDEHGKRRFHGAFTGGFSAGYFNSVGTKEGWKPKEFVSSRSQKVGAYSQRPEDFMDDEDLGEFGIAPQVLRPSAKFQSESQTDAARKRKHEHEPEAQLLLTNATINNILKPARETIGYKLLTEMGWRPGQGIGPRLTKIQKDKRLKSHKRIYGPTLPSSKPDSPESEDELSDDAEMTKKYKDFLFAPDELPAAVAHPKENQHGIGYKGLDRTSVLGNLSTSSGHFNLFEMPSTSRPGKRDAKARGGLKISGQAFGTGVYEEDDEDIYAQDNMSNYDFSLPTNQEVKAKDRQKKSESRWSVENLSDALEGFELDLVGDSEANLRNNFYPPPEIPKNWQPTFKRKITRFEPEKPAKNNPTPSQRKTLIENELEAKPVEHQPTTSEDQLQKLLSENLNATPIGFKPFAANPEKQSRYEKYLVCIKNNRGNALHLLQPKSMTEWERDREKVEFERAALLYQPLNNSMSSRFVSAGNSQDADAKKSVDNTEVDETKKAIKMKLFGRLTHERVEWHPCKLLCVRFNVKQPYNDGLMIGMPTSNSQKNKFDIFGQLEFEEKQKDSPSATITLPPGSPNGSGMEVETQSEETKSESKTEIEPFQKPPLDLFKSIFLDSDSSGSDSEQEEENKEIEKERQSDSDVIEVEQEETKTDQKNPVQSQSALARRPFAGKGLFANIDFDKLNQRSKTVQKIQPEPSKETKQGSKKDQSESRTKSDSDTESDDDPYGPAKPVSVPVSKINFEVKGGDESSDLEEWKEKKKDSKKKKKKEKKHKKEKKSEKKVKKVKKVKKEKRKKKRNKKDSDSTDSDDDSDD